MRQMRSRYGYGAFGAVAATPLHDDVNQLMGGARPLVKLGSTGNAVEAVRQLLARYGIQVAEQGAFGPVTAAAVSAFQRAKGLSVDGVVGTNTWAAFYGEPPRTTTGGGGSASADGAGAGAPGEMSTPVKVALAVGGAALVWYYMRQPARG